MTTKNSSDGPAASSFEKPRKVGWLQKHGGSGMSSHWKKRWFIVDHHYMFYYKTPTDKKPVGILCLPEYQSCHSTKESKKPYAFMLDKGNSIEESVDSGPLKNYILSSDSEEEMKVWMSAITEEIKPMLGVAPPMYGAKKGQEVKVDQKALDEVAAIVSEGPKLTHLTASRPKMKGRRPPKRYKVFHEEEEDSVESPPTTPNQHKPLPVPPSPTTSPTNSPATTKKGSRPSTPLLPSKTPLTPPTKPKANSDQATEVTETAPTSSPKLAFRKPQPPRKMTSRVDIDHTSESPSREPASATTGSKPVPKPPPKPRGSTGTSPPQTEASTALENHVNKPRPGPPPSKPRPKVKPRPSIPSEPLETSLTQQQSSPELPKRPTPAVRPTPVPRKRTSSEIEKRASSEIEKRASSEIKVDETKTVQGEEPNAEGMTTGVPHEPREPVETARKVSVETPRKVSVETPRKVSVETPRKVSVETARKVSMETARKVSTSQEVASEEQPLSSSQDHTHERAGVVTVEKPEHQEVAVEEQKPSESPERTPEHSSERGEEGEEGHKNAATHNGVAEADGAAEAEADAEMYEDMDYGTKLEDQEEAMQLKKEGSVDHVQKGKEEEEEEEELDAGSPNYVPMTQASPVRLGRPASETYEEVEAPGEDGGDNEYEHPEGWGDSSRHSSTSMGFDPNPVVVPEPTPFDNLPPTRPAYTNGDSSSSIFTSLEGGLLPDTHPPQSPDGRRSHSLSSCGSGSSGHLENASMQARKGSKGMLSLSSRSNSVTGGSGAEGNFTGSSNDVTSGRKAERPNSIERKGNSTSEKSLDLSDSHSVSGTLQQAKEILRLAQSMKAEAELMKEEAYRELELARRERHDASLLKKNAAEILRIAKIKLAVK